jgi:hypothetical protein
MQTTMPITRHDRQLLPFIYQHIPLQSVQMLFICLRLPGRQSGCFILRFSAIILCRPNFDLQSVPSQLHNHPIVAILDFNILVIRPAC